MTILTQIMRRAAFQGLVVGTLCASASLAQATSATDPGQSAAALPPAPAATPEAISAYERTLPGDMKIPQATGGSLPLTLDQAIHQALKGSLQLELSRQNERRVKGLTDTTVNALLPSLTAQGYTNTQEINLAAMGFKPAAIAPLLQQFGLSSFSTIVKVDVTSAQLNVNQQLFNVPAYFLYRAAQKAGSVAQFQTSDTQDSVALGAGTQYLRCLADAAQVENAREQVKSDAAALQQARDRQQAGVGVHLDTLRADVQLRSEQQSLISAENTYVKDKMQLNRLLELPADQELLLTDTVPFADLAMLPADLTVERAYTKRKDLLSLESQMEVARQTARAVRYQRLPTLAFGGFYGVIGETHGLYHGVFTAQGSLNVPIFQEAQFRGEGEVAQAQLMGLRHQIDSLRVTIDQQIRSSMLDVQSSSDLVKVARSNVDLTRQELADSIDRFKAGVEDNLPVVQAQATLAGAESQLVNRLFQYNVAKLQLARYVGDVETSYRSVLGH